MFGKYLVCILGVMLFMKGENIYGKGGVKH